MTKILIIEDDPFKQELLEQTIRAACSHVSIVVGRSVQQAVQLIKESSFDLVVLDMALPSHLSRPGGAQPISQPSGGVEVLLELSYDARSDRVVIVNEYPDIEFDGRLYPLSRVKAVLSRQLATNIFDVLYFTPDDENWRERLRKALT